MDEIQRHNPISVLDWGSEWTGGLPLTLDKVLSEITNTAERLQRRLI